MDRVEISPRQQRGVKSIRFDLHRIKKDYIEAISDWVVTTDIFRFYPSIYTHSIVWAAYGKGKVKSNLGVYAGSLAETRIDMSVRSGNRNQTVGIPIGPETSSIIANIISARIDVNFEDNHMMKNINVDDNRIDRLQDDWFVGTDSLEDAEVVLSAISSVYREYGLEINGSKTTVDRVIQLAEDRWVSEIGAFLSHKSGSLHGGRLREFLKLCLRLQKDHAREPVINYALSVLESQKPNEYDVEPLESFLLKAGLISPISRIEYAG